MRGLSFGRGLSVWTGPPIWAEDFPSGLEASRLGWRLTERRGGLSSGLGAPHKGAGPHIGLGLQSELEACRLSREASRLWRWDSRLVWRPPIWVENFPYGLKGSCLGWRLTVWVEGPPVWAKGLLSRQSGLPYELGPSILTGPPIWTEGFPFVLGASCLGWGSSSQFSASFQCAILSQA